MLRTFLWIVGATAVGMLIGAALLHLFPKLGRRGRALSAALCRAPGLDLLVTYFTIAPLVVGGVVGGWAGATGGAIGQIGGVLIWQWLHELTHRDAVRGPTLVKTTQRLVGRWRNHTAIWLTAIVTPMFWVVRVAEVTIYPLIARLVRFPRYNSSDWVNVSRHKFRGLVGHDLIWCLYCDWMTGVWSLGSEMLRNVESFWCPIRFDSAKKCANCAVDFPDINGGWVLADSTMEEVTRTVETMFADGQKGWFGHPARLTIGGKNFSTGGGNGAPFDKPDKALAQEPHRTPR